MQAQVCALDHLAVCWSAPRFERAAAMTRQRSGHSRTFTKVTDQGVVPNQKTKEQGWWYDLKVTAGTGGQDSCEDGRSAAVLDLANGGAEHL